MEGNARPRGSFEMVKGDISSLSNFSILRT